MLKLYLVRHGETDYNARNIVQGGGIDSSINELGRIQASRLYEHYHHIPFVKLYASRLQRTLQTLEPFMQLRHQIFCLSGLNEMRWGKIEGSVNIGEVRTIMDEAIQRWTAGETTYAVEGGESPEQVWQRASDALSLITSRHKEGNVLICTHGRTLRVMLAGMLGYGLSSMQHFTHLNTSVNVLVKVGERYYAEKLNDVSHLA